MEVTDFNSGISGFVYSDFLMVRSGVPQGSVLGPLLFNLGVNDLQRNIKNAQVTQFADDKFSDCK